jgi:cell shape-determining protein MreC
MRLYLIVFFAVVVSALSLLSSRGQTSVPTILQAASPAPAVVAKSAAAPEIDLKATLQLLQDMQATNAATIKKQEAALAVLDELEQAANELKIFSKRG